MSAFPSQRVPRPRTPSKGHPAPVSALSSLTLVLLLGCFGCGKGDPAPPAATGGGGQNLAPLSPDELIVLREVGAGYFEEKEYDRARVPLTRVVDSGSAEGQDYVNLACVELAAKNGELVRVRELLRRALAAEPELSSAHYCMAIVERRERNMEAAREHLQKVVDRVPGDNAARLMLSEVLADLSDVPAAIASYEVLLERGIEFAGGFYPIAVYQLSRILLIKSQDQAGKDRGRELMAHHKELDRAGIEQPSPEQLEQGTMGRVISPRPRGTLGRLARVLPTYEKLTPAVATRVGAVHASVARDIDKDGKLDLLALGEKGVMAVLVRGNSQFDEELLPGATADFAVIGDLGNHREVSVLLGSQGSLRLLTRRTGWIDETATLPAGLSATTAALVDFDHEGDLDLLLAGAEGLRLIRNEGNTLRETDSPNSPTGPVRWADATDGAGLPAGVFDWIVLEDFDADQDIDWLVGGKDAPTLWVSNLRKGRFEAKRTQLPDGLAAAPLACDLNADSFVDLLLAGLAPEVGINQRDGSFVLQVRPDLAAIAPSGTAIGCDLDLDGQFDLVGSGSDHSLLARLGSLLLEGEAGAAPLPARAFPRSGPLAVDIDGDCDLDLISPATVGIELYRCTQAPGHSFGLKLEGLKDNLDAVGVVLEVRAGPLYQRRMTFGLPEVVGTGTAARPDTVRLTWPNGVTQYLLGLEIPGCELAARQKEGLVGSCPFLYTWNGTRYEFISDVLGITPLGLPIAAGVYVPPDHDELVRIEDHQLRAKDGEFVMAITEELREVTYLDRAQLWVVEHERGIEVHPEERFSFPPFPPQHLHTLRDARPFAAVTGSDGRDWTESVRDLDAVHAVPFEPLPGQFLGLVSPHHLTVELPEQARTANKIRLVMTGWLYWTDASVNIAADQHETFAFIPPLLQVPDATGEFRTVGPPLGFPAGKTKTMVVDVTEYVNRDDLRLRLFTSIRLYWDQLRVALDDDDAPLQVTRIEPRSAVLDYRGFSAPLASASDDQPERFDYHTLREAPWNQHPGQYTRYGGVLPLLRDIDDQFVILAAGDRMDLRFDASELPPLAGDRQRTYLLFLDGWAKDGDPNTQHSQSVEPLPFHAMSGYPYADDERYPDDAVHQRYRAEWNTRPGQRLIPDLSTGPHRHVPTHSIQPAAPRSEAGGDEAPFGGR